MKENSNIYTPKLKYYHIILISMIISPLLIINSNSINKKREQEKLLKQDEIFLRKLYARKLDSLENDDNFISDTNKVCEKGSKELKEYYQTSDTSKIGVKEDEAISDEKNPEYIDALINLISGKREGTEDIKKYLMHIIPVLVFLVISILFLPGWLVCCICSCCNCYCCCCCKKPACKLPFYILTMAIYAAGIAISIYGLSQSNSIFVGLANTECSILKFIGEVLYGETKEQKPKWIGIFTLSDKFIDAKGEIDQMKGDLPAQLDAQKILVDNEENAFLSDLEAQSNIVKNNEKDLTNLLTDSSLKGIYELDIVNLFGKFTKSTREYTEKSLMQSWYNEYIGTAELANQFMTETTSNYKSLSNDNDAVEALNDGVGELSSIKDSFNDIKKQISNALIDYSEIIDSYGKLAFKIAFSVLMGINIIIAAFVTIKMFFSLLSCQNKCLNCLLKSLIHIFWNILAIITFVTLLLGSIFTLIGTVGKDLISVVNFLVSEENLSSDNTVLLESAPSYLTKCISGDGNITGDLGLDLSALSNIDQLTNAYTQLETAKQQAKELLSNKLAYNNYKDLFNEIIQYKKEDFYFLSSSKNLKFDSDILNKIHDIKQQDTWSFSCEDNFRSCLYPRTSETENFCIKPQTCDSSHKVINWYTSDSNNELKDYANILDAVIESISDIHSESNSNSISKALNSLNEKYSSFLDKEIDTLTIYQDKIGSLSNIFINITGQDGNITDIINCRFIGKNVKVVLKLLEDSLGKDFYTVGICLLVVGLASCISISFTILLNLILDLMKQKNNPDEIAELGGNKIINNDNGGVVSEGLRVINYDNY